MVRDEAAIGDPYYLASVHLLPEREDLQSIFNNAAGLLSDIVQSPPWAQPPYDGVGVWFWKPGLDTVSVDGREWAQVDLFTNLSWNDINAVCPEGACVGILNGHDMTGWTWASVDELNALFNFYIGSNAIGPGADDQYTDPANSAWAPAFFSDGWHPTFQANLPSGQPGWRAIHGIFRDNYWHACLVDSDSDFFTGDFVSTKVRGDCRGPGAWFYRIL